MKPIHDIYRSVLDPGHLRLLVEVHRRGSVSAAAAALGYSQPAATHQLKMLGRQVGAAVTIRVGRGIRLTEVGLALLGPAETVLRAIRAAEVEIAEHVSGGETTLRVGAFPSACAALVPHALVRLRATRPDLEVSLALLEPPQSLAQLAGGHCDVAVVYQDATAPPSARSALTSVPLLTDQPTLLLPREHALAGQHRVEITDLAEERWIVGSAATGQRLQRRFPDGTGPVPVLVAVDDYVAIQALVAAGMGVAVIPGLAVDAHRHPGVVESVVVGWPRRAVRAVCGRDLQRSSTVQATFEALRSAAGSLASPRTRPVRY